MITIGGLQIDAITTGVVAGVVETIDPSVILQFDTSAINHNLNHLPIRYPEPLEPVRLGVLHWPADASRFASFSVLIDSSQVVAFQAVAFRNSGPLPLAVTLNDEDIGGNVGTITTGMYALPLRPISQIAGIMETAGGLVSVSEPGLYLLTMVDQRYFWWTTTWSTTVTVGQTTWQNLISDVGSALVLSIDADPVPTAYGLPSDRFSAYQQPIPIYLDALAYTLGMRICVTLDGTVHMQSAATAMASNNASLTAASYDVVNQQWTYTQFQQNPQALHGGGVFSIVPVEESVPSSVTVWFSSINSGAAENQGYPIQVSLQSLAIPGDYAGVIGYAGSKVIVGDATAMRNGGGPNNLVVLQAYANQAATDWYNWQLGNVDLDFAGTVPWTPSAWVDTIQWRFNGDLIDTRVMRRPWNDRELGNIQYNGCSMLQGPIQNVNGFVSGQLQFLGHDPNNCLILINPVECFAGSGSGSGGGGTTPALDAPVLLILNSPIGLTGSIGMWVDVGLQVTIQNPGQYLFDCDICGALNVTGVTAGQTAYISAALYVNSVLETGSITNVIGTQLIASRIVSSGHLSFLLTLNKGDIVDLQAICNVTGGGTLVASEAKIMADANLGTTRFRMSPAL